MMSLTPPLPPIAYDDALRLALIYLNVASDPAGTKARLDELAARTQGLRDAVAQHEVAAKAAQDAAAALADVEQRARDYPRADEAPSRFGGDRGQRSIRQGT